MRKALTIFSLLLFCLTCGANTPQDERIAPPERDKVEQEKAFWDGLQSYIPKGHAIPVGRPKRIEQNLYVSENGWYETESVQNTAFYKKNLFVWQPVCEAARPTESVMTLLTGHVAKKRYTVNLLQHRYRFGTALTEVSLALLLEYCLTMGCTPYVGIESAEGDVLAATLFMVNQPAGYCHTFHFTFDKAILDQEDGMMQAEAYTFTPIHNLKQ